MGLLEGLVVGEDVGDVVGLTEGLVVGELVGDTVGLADGLAVGDAVGLCVGLVVGELVGGDVGLAVGAAVHSSSNAPELVCPAGQFAHWPSELPEHDCRVWLAKQPAHATHALLLDAVPGIRYVPLSHSVTVWLAQDK